MNRLFKPFAPAAQRAQAPRQPGVALGLLAAALFGVAPAAQAAIGLSGQITPLFGTPDGPSKATYVSESLPSFSEPVGYSFSAGSASTLITSSPGVPALLPGLNAATLDVRANGARAWASVDTAAGTVRTLAASGTAPYTAATARGEIADLVSFNVGPQGADIGVVLRVTGAANLGGFGGASVAHQVAMAMGGAQLLWSVAANGIAGPTFVPQVSGNWRSSSFSGQSLNGFEFRGVLHVANSGEFGASVVDYLTCSAGAVCDFSGTVALSLELPAGVSFTSRSGRFLASAVPEPGSTALLLAGLAAVGAAVRRRPASC